MKSVKKSEPNNGDVGDMRIIERNRERLRQPPTMADLLKKALEDKERKDQK